MANSTRDSEAAGQHRTQRSLDEDAPESRAVELPGRGNIIALLVLSGLHNRYARQASA